MAKILFAEDELVIGRLVKEALEREPNFEIVWAKNGREALTLFRDKGADLCILDVMMPAIDGFSLAKSIRAIDSEVPILFLTARADTADVVRGFNAGGNDYLKKPFSIEELVARIGELMRRAAKSTTAQPEQQRYQIGQFTFNTANQVLRSETVMHQLSGKEAELLAELARCKNGLLERRATLIKLWGDDNFFNARNMDVYIARLRKYFQHDPNVAIINVRGVGYKLVELS